MVKNDDENEKEKSIYEIGYLLSPFLSPEKISKTVSDFKEVLNREGGAIIADDAPKLRDLAYTMYKVVGHKKETFGSAYFGWIKFEIGIDDVSAIKKMFETNEAVIRFLLIATVRENTIASRRPVTRPSDRPRAEKGSIMSEEELEKTVAALVSE